MARFSLCSCSLYPRILQKRRSSPQNGRSHFPSGKSTVAKETDTKIPRIVEQYESEILADWTRELVRSAGQGAGTIPDGAGRP